MKLRVKKYYLKFFFIGVLVTFSCIVFGLYLTHVLTQKEEIHKKALWKESQKSKIMGPVRQKLEVMKFLIQTGQATPEEAFTMVDKTFELKYPAATQLTDEHDNILLSHVSPTFDAQMILPHQQFKLAPNRHIRVMMGPPELKLRNLKVENEKQNTFSSEVVKLIFLALFLSLSVGMGFFVIALQFYLKRKAGDVSIIMNRIKEGDLGARFEINPGDPAVPLMMEFNAMAKEIENLVTHLRSTEESRKHFLQELAHDLRTPVASIKSLQETLFHSGYLLSPLQKEQVQGLAMKEVNYFERLVEDLLFLSGVNDPRYKQTSLKMDLRDLIQEELEHFELKNLQIHCDLPLALHTFGDEHLLRRLFKNAFSNASRFAQSKLSVSMIMDEDQFTLSIRDDGPGLDEEDLHSFGEKKYSRLIQESHQQHISLGLGSVIMKKIMHLHRGELSIRNASPGAELILTFPK